MASSSGKVTAEWVGAYGFTLSDGTVLGPGVVVELPKGEAEESENWKVIAKSKAPDDVVVIDDAEAGEENK